MTSRRAFIKGASKATAGILFGGCSLVDSALGAMWAPPSAPQAGGKRREVKVGGQRVTTVDFHCHGVVSDVWDLVKDQMEDASRADRRRVFRMRDAVDENSNLRNADQRLAKMDEIGIDIQAVSINPFWDWMKPELARRVISFQNEKIAELCAAYPDRFVGLGTVALHHPDLAAEQVEEGVKKFGMRGFAIGGSVNGEELANPKFHPFWAKAEELGAVVFIHPHGFSGDGPDSPEQKRFHGNGLLGNVIGQPLETTVALSHLILEGTLDRFPNVKICAAHGGGYLPHYSGRQDQCTVAFPKECKPVKKPFTEYLKQIYYDSLVITAPSLRHVIDEVGVNQVVLGTDYPTPWNFDAVDRVLAVPGLTNAEQKAILGGTAAKLLRIKS